ncbi:MAG: hypothetical protein PUJ82_02810 [Spirochaetales bacterium]|nr:hypothetical protein [Spirochaetales bacterium]MDY5913892.1 hypothetical protein [Treponema sp.]
MFIDEKGIIPIEIKKEIAPKNPTKNFNVLNKYKHEIKTGQVIDCAEKLRPLNDVSWCLPVYMLGLLFFYKFS